MSTSAEGLRVGSYKTLVSADRYF